LMQPVYGFSLWFFGRLIASVWDHLSANYSSSLNNSDVVRDSFEH
jgi:hypothetical protein